jgi:hypothetical protein
MSRDYRPRVRRTVLLISALLIGWTPTATTRGETPAGYLEKQQPPVFRDGHTLPRLSRFGWTLPLEARVELAKRWGYALELGGYTTERTIEIMDDPESLESKIIALARSDPATYPLQVILSRKLPGGESEAAVAEPPTTAPTDDRAKDTSTGAADNVHFRRPGVNPPGDPWTRTADGALVADKKVWSPEAPGDVIRQSAAFRADPLAEVARRAPVAVVLNGGEYALNVIGFAKKHWEQDPRIQQARGDTPWFPYISQRKAHMESAIHRAVAKAAPDRQVYVFYTAGGGTHRNRYGGWDDWAYGYRWMRHACDVPSGSYYYRSFNDGWTGEIDILTQALNAKGHELHFDQPLSYHWLCAGWPRKQAGWPQRDIGKRPDEEEPGLGDLTRYMGFLKCMYTTGMLGGNGGYYAFPEGGFGAEFASNKPPHWLRQMIVLARAHAMFSHLEEYLRQGDLLPGPEKHVWSTDQPAYEFPTGDKTARVLARKHRDRPEWLIAAWAAGGPQRDVSTELPELGPVTLVARPAGGVYLAEKTPDGKVAIRLLDRNPTRPSADVARAMADRD